MSRDIQYIGMDVHKEAIVIAVLNGSGKLVMETILETKASSILQFIHGLRGELHVTWEEGTWAAWLYGSKSDMDARKLAELLRTGMLRPVYHGENGLRTLRELARSYQTISKDLTRVMNRLKALYRGWGIPCAARSCSTNSWMDYTPCGETCDPSFWPRAGNIRQRSCCARFPASVRFEQPT